MNELTRLKKDIKATREIIGEINRRIQGYRVQLLETNSASKRILFDANIGTQERNLSEFREELKELLEEKKALKGKSNG